MSKTREQTFTHTTTTEMMGYNEEQAFRPESYARFMGHIIEIHLAEASMAIPEMMERYNVSWALLSEHFYINRHPKMGETLTIKTWASGMRSMLFLRDFVCYDQEGEVVFGAANTSAIYDLEARKMLKSGPIFDKFQFPIGENLYKDKVKMPLRGYELEDIGTFVVPPSYLDSLGHMNNTRYAEVLYNYASDENRAKVDDLCELELHFQQELSLREEMILRRFESEKETVMAGYKKNEDGTAGHLAFAGKMVFR